MNHGVNNRLSVSMVVCSSDVCYDYTGDAKSKEILEKFLTSSIKFYTQLINIVQSKFSFQLSELVNNQIEFTSRTRHRMVKVGRGGVEFRHVLELGMWEIRRVALSGEMHAHTHMY